MGKRLKATINPALLVWARSTAGYELPDAAQRLDIDPERLRAWEEGAEPPSIPQLRKLAEIYKRPLAVLYLPEPPAGVFEAMHDFRRLPAIGPRRFSPGLTLEIRNAQQRRSLALELLEDLGDKPQPFEFVARIDDAPEEVGLRIRDALDITYERQRGWRDVRIAFHSWRSRIEQQGVLIFQASRIGADEASGFAFAADVLPLIVVNRKDVYARRAFSLLHEFAHLLLHRSGVSDLEVEAARASDDARLEIWCNQVAAAAMMPRDRFLAEDLVAVRGVGRHAWSDQEIETLARIYAVSREAIVRRLLTFGRATDAFYAQKRAQYQAEFQEQRARQRELAGDDGIPRNMPRETVADFGRPFVRMILENYHQDRITLSDVSGYLGVKVRHIAGIEQQLVRG